MCVYLMDMATTTHKEPAMNTSPKHRFKVNDKIWCVSSDEAFHVVALNNGWNRYTLRSIDDQRIITANCETTNWRLIDESPAKTSTDNLCAQIHEPEFVTIAMTVEQMRLLQTICDVIRDDDDETNPCIDFAAALYAEIDAELKQATV